ncbi:hypothetical protein ES288_A08G147600v1 [Gossypium darwinii]|uniref:Uncharacterized protein n=1 Tax=Gossypium darwinii TaxID=34276 RepID=A0A5D2FK67_GOSDA|nr:hypothetical protein ES288_A08G147600v1 [Gossypium darwinii]
MAMETLDDEKPEEEEVIDKENKEGSEKLNRSSAVSANTPSKICHTFPGNGRYPLTAEELEEKERLLEEEHTTAALQYFLRIRSKTALHSLLH